MWSACILQNQGLEGISTLSKLSQIACSSEGGLQTSDFRVIYSTLSDVWFLGMMYG